MSEKFEITYDQFLSVLADPRSYGMTRLRQLLAECFVPRVFYDIGANNPFSPEGQQTVFKPLMPETKFFLFEAMAKHEPALKTSNEPYAIAILGEQDGMTRTFYESKANPSGNGDSLYLERTRYYRPETVVASQGITRRLDSLVEERGWPLPDFMKVDTQGSELDVLRGGPRCLANARGLQLECAIRKYNEGAPLLPDVLSFVQNNGFRLYDISEFHFNSRKELMQVDMLFVRPECFKDGD